MLCSPLTYEDTFVHWEANTKCARPKECLVDDDEEPSTTELLSTLLLLPITQPNQTKDERVENDLSESGYVCYTIVHGELQCTTEKEDEFIDPVGLIFSVVNVGMDFDRQDIQARKSPRN